MTRLEELKLVKATNDTWVNVLNNTKDVYFNAFIYVEPRNLIFWRETVRIPFWYWEPSQKSCSRNAHVTDRGGLAHGQASIENSDQSQASIENFNQSRSSVKKFRPITGFTGNSEQSQASLRNSDQSQPFVGNMKEYEGNMEEI